MDKRWLLVSILFLLSSGVNANWQASWLFTHDGSCAVEGMSFQAQISLTAKDSDLWFDAIKMETQSGIVFGTFDKVDNLGWSVKAGETITWPIATGNYPSPTSGNQLSYKFCLYERGLLDGYWSCTGFATTQLTPRTSWQCYSNSQCSSAEYCSINNCVATCKPVVAQTNCGKIENHAWVSYQCCSNADCGGTETCVDHVCASIPCSCGYISNQQCVRYECCSDSDCGYGRYCSNNVCQQYGCMSDTDCANTEQCSNHNCVAVWCDQECSYVENHVCKKYECCSDGACPSTSKCVNNRCEEVSCAYGEFATSHACQKHECMSENDCSDDKKCENNKCTNVQCPGDNLIKNHECRSASTVELLTGYVDNNQIVPHFSSKAFRQKPSVYWGLLAVILLIVCGLVLFVFRNRIGRLQKSLDHFLQRHKHDETHESKDQQTTLRNCHKCGHKLRGNALFCTKCGARV